MPVRMMSSFPASARGGGNVFRTDLFGLPRSVAWAELFFFAHACPTIRTGTARGASGGAGAGGRVGRGPKARRSLGPSGCRPSGEARRDRRRRSGAFGNRPGQAETNPETGRGCCICFANLSLTPNNNSEGICKFYYIVWKRAIEKRFRSCNLPNKKNRNLS